MSFIISDAFAQTTTSPIGGSNSLVSIMMMVGFVIIFYFLLIRPQAKRAKEHRNLISNLTVGDEIVTNGGLLGKIVRLEDDIVVLALAENVEIKLQKNAISSVLPKGTLKNT